MGDNKRRDRRKFIRIDSRWRTPKEVSILFLMLFAMFSVMVFFIGMHNIDMGYNIANLEVITGEVFFDKATDGKVYNGPEGYMLGINQIRLAFVSATMLMIAIGYAVGRMHG